MVRPAPPPFVQDMEKGGSNVTVPETETDHKITSKNPPGTPSTLSTFHQQNYPSEQSFLTHPSLQAPIITEGPANASSFFTDPLTFPLNPIPKPEMGDSTFVLDAQQRGSSLPPL